MIKPRLSLTKTTFQLQALWLAWLLLLLSPILFQISELNLIALRQNLILICHQKIDRFFAFGDYHALVCSRCVGIYLGLVLFGFFKLSRSKLLATLLFILPILLDKILEHLTDIHVGNEFRFISGLIMAFAISSWIGILRKTKD